MKDSPQYRISQAAADSFVPGQRHGMLMAAELRKRGGDGDARAADWIDYYNEMQA
ncbi:MAG TPA: hypothetical protein VKY39_02720 [Aggregatilineales bacterium]|nr:hypothetical protein [Aggregatilineales bacterium]